MAAGSLDKRITVKKNVPGKNALNEDVPNWVEHKKLWANIKFETGVEFNRANREGTEIKASIKVRLRGDIVTTMRIDYKHYVFYIKGDPLPADDGEFMFIPVSTKEV